MASLKLGFHFNGKIHAVEISFDIRNIKSIEDIIKKAIIEFIEKLLRDPLVWLQGVLEGAIKIDEEAIEKAKQFNADRYRAMLAVR